jgi:hypothetical protein
MRDRGMSQRPSDKTEYGDEEAERRTREAIRRSFDLPRKQHKELVGTTPRAKAAAKRKAKGSPKSL